ncbi:MAG: magnesium/cobalt transporter CorA [Chitinophagaceae bacterium]
MRRRNKFLHYLDHGLDTLFGIPKTKKIPFNIPATITQREDAGSIKVVVNDYTATTIEKHKLQEVAESYRFKDSDHISWINIDGLRKSEVEGICNRYGVHPLIAEDILSLNQRPKMDEVDGVMYCLLNMLYFNGTTCSVEQEQISIVFGKNFVISFQEDARRDAFNPIRDKLIISNSKLRQRGSDYLCYAMLDMIVDNYFVVMEKLGERIEWLEDVVIKVGTNRSLSRINQVRKELNVLKRNIVPVREIINGFLRSESELLEDRTTKYFKDIYDHIVQAIDITETYREMVMSLQDLYINNVNLRMNQVMKVMAIVTCLMAPATVIGGIFGMNFDRIPYIHTRYGFLTAVAIMLIIPIWMLRQFKRKGWF